MSIPVNTGNTQVNFLLERYRIWCDYRNFYHEPHEPVWVNADHGLPVYNARDVDGINSNTADSIVVIDNMVESINPYSLFCKYRDDKHYIFINNDWWDPDHWPLPYKHTCIPVNFYLFEMADTYLSPNRFSFYLDREYKFEYPKPFLFVSTTGRHRPDRDRVVNSVLPRLEFTNYVFRYAGQDLGQHTDADVVRFDNQEFDPYTAIQGVEQYYHNVSQTLPIKLYNQGYFNLSVESNSGWLNQFQLTEKTIKMLLTGMPFVAIASSNFLKHLHSFGFKTYSSVWDESYDSCEDYGERLVRIASLCNSLSQFDWPGHADELQSIANHNKLNFMKLGSHAESMWSNFEKAVKDVR